jgi:hypothetical protein
MHIAQEIDIHVRIHVIKQTCSASQPAHYLKMLSLSPFSHKDQLTGRKNPTDTDHILTSAVGLLLLPLEGWKKRNGIGSLRPERKRTSKDVVAQSMIPWDWLTDTTKLAPQLPATLCRTPLRFLEEFVFVSYLLTRPHSTKVPPITSFSSHIRVHASASDGAMKIRL